MTNSILLLRRSVLHALFTLASAVLIGGMAAPSIQAGDLLPYKGTVEGTSAIVYNETTMWPAELDTTATLIATQTGKGVQTSTGWLYPILGSGDPFGLGLDPDTYYLQAVGVSTTIAPNGEKVWVWFILQEVDPAEEDFPHSYVGWYYILSGETGTEEGELGEGLIVGKNLAGPTIFESNYRHTFNGTIAKSVLKTQPAKKKK